MNYDLNLLDPQHKEAYRKCTDLLQVFIDRQCWLRKEKKKDYHTEYDSEKKTNAIVISIIQWVRYHLMGNDDVSIWNKCHINQWFFRNSGTLLYYSQFACEKLNLDPGNDHETKYIEICEAVLKHILPDRSNSIFATDDNIQESITLKTEVERIRRNYDPIC